MYPNRQYTARSNLHRSSRSDINIILMSETGVGKSTFINAFANYLIYKSLDEALNNDMKVLIPASFHVINQSSRDLESIEVSIGTPSEHEHCEKIGASSTQICQSYTFSLGNRVLRLIDTPGICDVRGIEQDEVNCDHILNYLSQYEHLNGICILFKPNEERLSVSFRYCFKQLLSQLNISATENLMFVFTCARSTFYRIGSTAQLVKQLLKEVKETWNVKVPFNTDNTFTFDNEAFRFLAMKKKGVTTETDEESYYKSWQKSVDEVIRLLERIGRCGLHAVKDTISINAARQVIHQLARPLGEVARLIQENIVQADNCKQDIIHNPRSSVPKRILQKMGKSRDLGYPRTVCTTENRCTEIITIDGQQKTNYKTQCHRHCYLPDIQANCIGRPILKYCHAINKTTGNCNICGCNWKQHMHVTYEYDTYNTYIDINNSSQQSALADIDKRINALRQEEAAILNVCNQLARFVRRNSIVAHNNDVTEYIRYFIREEETKYNAGANNEGVIQGLKKMIEDHEKTKNIFDKNSSETNSGVTDFSECADIFYLTSNLYDLPINGASIREQVEQIKNKQLQVTGRMEHSINVPYNINTPVIQSLNQMKN